MNSIRYWTSLSAEEKKRLAESINTSVNQLSQNINGHKRMGQARATALHKLTSGKISRVEMRPDIWGEQL